MDGAPPAAATPLIEAVAVLDASAILAVVYAEPGMERVQQAIRRGALISVVNWAESLSKITERGERVEGAVRLVEARANVLGVLNVMPFEERDAVEAARLRVPTRHLGLSLADRACLALGRLRRLPVLTTDRAWRSLHISVTIEVIR